MPPPPCGGAVPGAPPRPQPCVVPCARSFPCARSWHAFMFSSGSWKLLVRSSHHGTAWNRPYQHSAHRPGSGRHTPKSGRMSPKSGGRTPRGRHSPPPSRLPSAEKPAGGESAREESIRRSEESIRRSSAKQAADSAKQAAEKGGGEAGGRQEATEAKPAGSAKKTSKSGGGSSKAPARSGAEVAAEVDRLHLSSRPPVVRPEDVRSHPEPWRTVPYTEEDIAKRAERLDKSPISSRQVFCENTRAQ